MSGLTPEALVHAEACAEIERLRAALTSEDEIAHGEAWTEARGGLGRCAYCNDDWPCRTQRGVIRALAALDERHPKPKVERFEYTPFSNDYGDDEP